MFIKVKTDSLNEFSKLIPLKLNNEVRIKSEIMKIIIVKKYLLISLKSKLILENNNLFIKIEDDGPGIPEKEYENVFKPFYKIDKGRADSKSSVGLGLSIASDIIRSHGGNIKLEKSSLNGLGVKIFLPV